MALAFNTVYAVIDALSEHGFVTRKPSPAKPNIWLECPDRLHARGSFVTQLCIGFAAEA